MGHPMAKKGFRKGGDKFIKHQDKFYDNQFENFNNFQEDDSFEDDIDTAYESPKDGKNSM